EKRLDEISRQQDELLETAAERTSMFAMYSNEDFSSAAIASSNNKFVDITQSIMKKAGIIDMSVNLFVGICVGGGIILTALLTYFNFVNPFAAFVIGNPVGAYLAYSFLAMKASRTRTAFLEQFPDAIDMMIRGVKAGLNIARVIKLVSLESRDPIAQEYRTISQKFDLGMKPEEVLIEAADRVNIEEFKFLVVALVLQMENGGVLAEILHNLSSLVRKRLELGLKVHALSSEARISAFVLSALPFVFAGIMALLSPSHLLAFTKPGMGQTLLKIGIVLFLIGTFLMIKATKLKV
ncbi:MAG: type II secretion system F family protein, partial [Holosporaceae bacterium]|nr:type II secretion system F family protein [Holosporaceae bacterium]